MIFYSVKEFSLKNCMRLIFLYSCEKCLIEYFKGFLFCCICSCINVKGSDMCFYKELYFVILGIFLYFIFVLNECVSIILIFVYVSI